MSGTQELTDAEALAALDWYRAIGVDLAVAELPVDRFAASLMPSRGQAAVAVATSAPSAPGRAGNADAADSRKVAAMAETLEDLRVALETYDGCVLKKRATQLCFADGNPAAEVMLVGESPDEEDDLAGKPFAGRAGRLLDQMLAAIGLDRNGVYIANMVPWRPPGNREPSPEELALCAPFLFRQVELAAPKFLVALGNVPSRSLLDAKLGITRMRGQWRQLTIGGHQTRAIATFHPQYLLRSPASKQLAWRDLLSLRQAIDDDKIASA